MHARARCPNCGERTVPLLAKAGISAREPIACPACGARLELGPVWGWLLAVAAPALFSMLLILLFVVLDVVAALLLTLLISSVVYVTLIVLAPLRATYD
jgi:DNA-directed RNA polymerase subunit RPC12/RpoP